MDILRFVNSKDIREHLRKLNYQFTTTEAAWMVWQCKDASMEEKHKVWEEIIETMPDCPIEKRHLTDPRASMHVFLRELMALEDKQIERLYKEEFGTVYSYSIFSPENDEWEEYEDLLTKFDLCKECIKREMEKREKTKEVLVRIKKVWLDSQHESLEVEFNGYLDVKQINNYVDISEYEQDMIRYGFEGMWFAFPTPFESGDILTECERDPVLFVFEEVDAANPRRKEYLQKNGDAIDMIARGYSLYDDTGEIFPHLSHDYMSLEYYRGDLSGYARILKPLSNYLKGRISIDLYSNAYRTIITDEQNKSLLFSTWVGDEKLKLAGLKE